MAHTRPCGGLRVASYIVLLCGLAWLVWDGAQPLAVSNAGSVSSMGHIGAGIGSAIEWLGEAFLIFALAGALNAASLSQTAKPRTWARKIEFGVFCLPGIGAAGVFMLVLH